MSEHFSSKLKNIASIKNYKFYKNKNKNINNLFNHENKNKSLHYIYDLNIKNNESNVESCVDSNTSDTSHTCDTSHTSDTCNNCDPCNNCDTCNNCNTCNNEPYNSESSDFYNKRYHLNIKNLKIEHQDFNIESNILKLNTSSYIFSKNIIQNLDILINTWQNIIYSTYKYKSAVEHLMNEISDNIDLTLNDLKMNFKKFTVIINTFVNELIMASKTLFTNDKNIFSIYISRNNSDYDTMFSHIITKPKKFAYYLNPSNTLTLFNIPIFGVNIDDSNHLVLQIVRQDESVSTTHNFSKIEPTLYKLSPKIIDNNDFCRGDCNEKVSDEKSVNLDNSFKFLSHYYCSIINDVDIYHYSKSDLSKLLRDFNIEIDKLNYIKKTYCN